MKNATLCLLLALCLLGPLCATAEDAPDALAAYLAQVALPLVDLPAQAADYAGLDAYDVLLIGESHGTQKAYEAEKLLLAYFVQVQGVRHIALEIGYSGGQLLGRYLETGDVSYLNALIDTVRRDSLAYTEETYDFWLWLGALHAALPEGDGLSVYGVDVEMSMATPCRWLSMLLPPERAPDAIARMAETYLRRGLVPGGGAETVLAHAAGHAAVWQAYLGDAYGEFCRTLSHMARSDACTRTEDFNCREQYLKDSLVAAIDAAGGARVAGIFGSAHVLLNGAAWQGTESNLASFLMHEHAPTRGRVAALVMDFGDSGRVGHAMPSDMNLCPLDASDGITPANGGNLLDYAQYMLVILDSPAATRYQGR